MVKSPLTSVLKGYKKYVKKRPNMYQPGSRLEVGFDNTDFRLFWSGRIQTYENHFTIFSERNQVRISRAEK
jgi:hypothetical protein